MPSAPIPTTTTLFIAASFATRTAAAALIPDRTPTAEHRWHPHDASAPSPAPAPSRRRPARACSTAARATCPRSSARSRSRAARQQHAPRSRATRRPARWRTPSRPGLRRPVDVVGATHPRPRHGGEHDDRSAARRPHGGGQHGQQSDLGGEVGVHDRGRVRGVDLGTRLVAEDPERHHRGADRAVLGDDRLDETVRARRGRRRRTRAR